MQRDRRRKVTVWNEKKTDSFSFSVCYDKSQGQACFGQGQLCVASSRVGYTQHVQVVDENTTEQGIVNREVSKRNRVYKEVCDGFWCFCFLSFVVLSIFLFFINFFKC